MFTLIKPGAGQFLVRKAAFSIEAIAAPWPLPAKLFKA
jgi:hypothetical protein